MTNLELSLVRKPIGLDVPAQLVHQQKSSSAAFSLACQASGLEDKEIYMSLGIDAGHFSRIKKGEAGFPPDKIRDFCELVGNTIYPEWIAYQVGCMLVVIETESERRAKAAEERARVAEDRVKFLSELLQGRAA